LIADEMQDCGRPLYKILEMWATEGNLSTYVAADPYQAIFKWAGTSAELFDEFPGVLNILPHSHRLPPQIKDYAEKIIALANLPFPKFTAADKVGEITYNGHVNKIDWLNLGPTFLLARTNRQLYKLSQELKQMGVPYTAGGGPPIWTPLESSKGEAYLTLIKLHARERVNADDLRALAKHTHEPWLVRGAKTRIKELVQAEYNFKEIAHFFKPDFLSVIADDFAPVLCKDIDEDDRSYLHRVYKKCGVAAFLKPPDIVLSTIHGSKGREKETVVISQELGKKVYDSFLKDKQSEVFVAYVAATRSMKRIIMLQRESPESFPYPRIGE
jgi:superfamily I DNA/RNA helicase